jgi:hypothetical protein
MDQFSGHEEIVFGRAGSLSAVVVKRRLANASDGRASNSAGLNPPQRTPASV